MLDLLLAAVTVPALVALGLALLASVTLVPFVLAVGMAEARGFSTARWGAVALAGSLLGLALTLLFVLSDRIPPAASLVPLALTWVGPIALWLLNGDEVALGGRAGRHE